MADLAPGALRQGLRHAAGSIGAAVQATSGAAAAAARLNLLYEGYSGKEILSMGGARVAPHSGSPAGSATLEVEADAVVKGEKKGCKKSGKVRVNPS